MIKRKLLIFFFAAVVALATITAVLADDGKLLRKSMSKAPGQPDTRPVSEADHAFIDMMKFYVPSQAASGLLTPVDYIDADGALREQLIVAKPLVNVFIHGPKFGVPDTAFGHSFMDTYAAVSLDDGRAMAAAAAHAGVANMVGFNYIRTPASRLARDIDAGVIVLGATRQIFDQSAWESVSARVMIESGRPVLVLPPSRHEPTDPQDDPQDFAPK